MADEVKVEHPWPNLQQSLLEIKFIDGNTIKSKRVLCARRVVDCSACANLPSLYFHLVTFGYTYFYFVTFLGFTFT